MGGLRRGWEWRRGGASIGEDGFGAEGFGEGVWVLGGPAWWCADRGDGVFELVLVIGAAFEVDFECAGGVFDALAGVVEFVREARGGSGAWVR